MSPTPFSEEGQEELALLVDVFDWQYTTPFEHTFLTGPIDGTEWNTRGYESPNEDGGGLAINGLDNTWGFTAAGYHSDPHCFECTPMPFGEDGALARARVVLEQLGLDLDDLSIRASVLRNDGDEPTSVLVIASLLVEGVRTDVKWVVGYRNSDGLLAQASGEYVTVSELGEVPVLTPAEALEIAGRPVTDEAVADAELTLETRFNLDTGERTLVPVYSVPVSDNLAVDVTIAATRPQDIPASPQAS
ncbi:MAG: hypothetical protein ACRBK7_24170 [Acidimicrobiales bacterium]